MNFKSDQKVNSIDDKIQYWLLVFFRVSVVIAIILSVIFGELWPFLYSLLALVLMYLPELISSRVKITLPIEFDFVLVIFMYMAVFLGKAGRAYDHFWWWDVLLHTSSGFIIGFVAFLMLYIIVAQKRLQASGFIVGLFIFSVGLAFGAIWEVFEYGLALVFGGNLTADGLRDTIQDLIVDGVGALIMAWFGVQHIFNGRKGFITRWAESFVKLNPALRSKK